ncbi:MAG: BspA family leucine-rich repeat surface protein [Bacilli bacterium]|nr:BspA family leucine-rich repeat surface protein [Bacilli bacterium]
MVSIKTIFTNIANAIRTKKGTSAKYLPENMAEEISTIETGSSEDRLKKLLDATKSAYYLFYQYQGTSVSDLITYSDTENVTNMRDMFENSKIETAPLINTSNVTYMDYMFYQCSNLTTIPQLDTSKNTSMYYTFGQCSNLQIIDITHMKITSTSSSSNMCNNCYSLTKFIIRNMDTIPALNSNAFYNCYHFTGTVNATYNPEGLKNGRIYVPDGMVDSLKSATNWSVYADIIVPLSTLVE